MDYVLNIAKSLSKFMTKKRLTVEKLSELSGVSTRTISRLRNGTLSNPKLDAIVAICDVINVSVDEMLDRDCCGIDETMMMNYHLLPERDKKIAELLLSDNDLEEQL
jgi:transcriptional regulator with XRE-family HTH domain